MKALIVEPDSLLRNLYKQHFVQAGVDVVGVSGAQDALNSINDFMPDLIFMDLELPKNSGFELIYELRSYTDLDRVKIYINTMIREEELVKKFGNFKKDLMINKVLYKPEFSIKKIIRELND